MFHLAFTYLGVVVFFRAPSAYNIFMKKELEKLKTSSPTLDHKGRFAAAAANWTKVKK